MSEKQNFLQRAGQYRIFFAIACAVFAIDQLSKVWVSNFSGLQQGLYPPYGGINVIPGLIDIVYAVNTGAAWGIFAGKGFLLILMAVLVIGLLFHFRKHLEFSRKRYQICFAMLVGGIIGNAYDRLAYGHVIDFLDFHIGNYRWPTFNIADCGIVVGAFLYIILSSITERKLKKQS